MDALLRRYKTILIAGLLMAACTARSQELDRPVILVASPELQGLYSRTALIAVPAASGQHIGFILNRATEMNLATVFPDHAPSAKVVDPVYLGGPEMLGSLFALVPRDPGVPGLRLFGEVFVVASGDAVDVVIEKMPNEARYLTGFRRLAGRRARQGARVRLLDRHRARRGAYLQRQARRHVGRAAEAQERHLA